MKPFPGVRELFERIKADGKRIALASSAKGDELDVYKGIADIAGLGEVETLSDDAEEVQAPSRHLRGGDGPTG